MTPKILGPKSLIKFGPITSETRLISIVSKPIKVVVAVVVIDVVVFEEEKNMLKNV